MRLLVLLLLAAACAHGQKYRDSPQFSACKQSCVKDGTTAEGVYEDEDRLMCVCKKKPPDPA